MLALQPPITFEFRDQLFALPRAAWKLSDLRQQYAPFPVQEVLVGIRHADADVIRALTGLLDLDISRASRNHDDFFVSQTFAFVVEAAGGLALSTVTVTDTATVFCSVGIHGPIATDFLRIGNIRLPTLFLLNPISKIPNFKILNL